MPRSSMAALITRTRLLINDPSGAGQVFDDQTIQDILDACRSDVINWRMIWRPTYQNGVVQFLNYYIELGDWEDDVSFTQNLLTTVTPTTSEPIAGHWFFSTSTYPEVYITGKTYDVYKAAADLLERWSAKQAQQYDVIVGGQTFRRSQSFEALQKLALSYRRLQRPFTSSMIRTDIRDQDNRGNLLGPRAIDYFAKG